MLTGIELGPATCVLVRTRREGSGRGDAGPAIADARLFEVGNRRAFTSALGRARRDEGFSRLARVVAWGPPGTQIALDLDHVPDVSPIIEAGFEIESIVSPPQALGLMLESLRVDTRRAVAAVALNRHGAAIAIVHDGRVLAARTFEWTLGEPFSGTRPEQLERYLVISQVAPHLQHLIDLVAPLYNAAVSSAVMCGDLPDLRSLAMLLIEEMDLEVETLDSSEMFAPGVAQQTESAAGLQLAAAVASGKAALSAPAAQLLDRADDERQSFFANAVVRRLVGSAAFVLCASWASLQVAGWSPAAAAFPNGLATAARVELPAPSAPKPEATIGRMDPEPAPPPVPPSRVPGVPRSGTTSEGSRPLPVEPLVASDPLPRVDGIAIGGERRLAIVEGVIVAPGDRVGRRIVKRIETNGVLFRDPGGGDVFVPIRARKPPPL